MYSASQLACLREAKARIVRACNRRREIWIDPATGCLSQAFQNALARSPVQLLRPGPWPSATNGLPQKLRVARRFIVLLPAGPPRTPNEVLNTFKAAGGFPVVSGLKDQRGWFKTLIILAKTSSLVLSTILNVLVIDMSHWNVFLSRMKSC